MTRRFRLGLVGLALVQGMAWAARPMVTDDANVVDPGSCQLESWVKHSGLGTERWALPGCNFFFDTEVSLGSSRQGSTLDGSSEWVVFQVKKRWIKLEPGRWGVSTTIGHVDGRARAPSLPANSLLYPVRDGYVNVPLTYLSHQGWIVHVNAGFIQHQFEHKNRPTWGLGGEWPWSARSYLIAEAYGESGTRSKVQVGLRTWIKPQKLQLDTTIGQPFGIGGDQRWISMGIRWLGDPLF
ncbi:MAG: hypothetical protein QM527_09495 [Alphaproteobacteria bacterium]|nr:hypothetical protein [Alphaproteobacteria bacterium]